MEFGELIDHLNDLIALAESEGFPVFAAELVAARDRLLKRPPYPNQPAVAGAAVTKTPPAPAGTVTTVDAEQ